MTIESGALKAGSINQFQLSRRENTSATIDEDGVALADDFIYVHKDLKDLFIIGNDSAASLRSNLWETIEGGGWRGYWSDFVDASGWSNFFDAVAEAATAMIRSPTNPRVTTIHGPAYVEETYVKVRWVWLVLPLFLVVFSALFLLLTAMRSRRKLYLYKTSILPLLFHPVNGLQKKDLC